MNITSSSAIKLSQRFFNWLVPACCVVCQTNRCSGEQMFCDSCDLQSQYRPSYCQACGQSFSANLDYCGRCLVQAPMFDNCICPFEFAGPVKELIWRFKYQQQPYLAKPLAKLFCTELDLNNGNLPEALIAVPSHPITLRKRGYNQSNLLANEIGKRLNIPVLKQALRKTRHTRKQSQLGLNQRQSNLKNSFELVKLLQVQHLAIVDDVITTSATISEISHTLKKNGVDYTQAWGLAHTP